MHGIKSKAYRECYEGTIDKAAEVGGIKLMRQPKIRKRVSELLDKHHAGEINLYGGPWKHYGDPEPAPDCPQKKLRFYHLLQSVDEDDDKRHPAVAPASS